MSAPRRWLESPDAPLGARELLHAARSTETMLPEIKQRIGERIADLSFLAKSGAAASGAHASGVAGSAMNTTLAKVCAGTLAASALAGGVHAGLESMGSISPLSSHEPQAHVVHVERASAPLPAIREVVRKTEQAGESALLPASNAFESTPRSIAIHADTKTSSVARRKPTVVESQPEPRAQETKDTRDRLAEETSLLDKAKRKSASSPAAALADLEEHRLLFGNGVLAPEREFIRIDTLFAAGYKTEAEAAAHAQLARDPNGLYASRIRQWLARHEPADHGAAR